ncbi:MAG: translation initiation factor IF-2 [Candidatus Portnoybacteria bacterium]|nr:translation initiation factor IF-2 [Candidatus Portnoybacteria bacterium]
MIKKDKKEKTIERPPIVVVLGHVDHGKTTLLDTIRETNVVEGESGGITQHIGAYQIEHDGKAITFIDTPGHEAFSQMRSRGAKAADIAVIIIAAEEGIKPQTKEVISYIKENNIPVIVALNKIDKAEANPQKVIGELASEGLLVEERGGDVPSVNVSAKQGTGIDELLEMISLVAEMEELKADLSNPGSGVVVESYLDSNKGPTATFLLFDGELSVGNWVACGKTYGKIRSLEDFKGDKMKNAIAGMPAVIVGLNEVPVVGEKFKVVEGEEGAKSISKEAKEKEGEVKEFGARDSDKVFNIILKADVRGCLEAIEESFKGMDLAEVKLRVLKSEIGDISEADIKMAYPANALIVGFRVKTSKDMLNLAKRRGVVIKTYNVIYELFEDIKREAAKLLDPEVIRKRTGQLKVLAIFRKEKARMIIGGKVTTGKIENKAKVDVLRGGEKITSGRIVQLQHNKQDIPEVEKGREAGMLFEGDPVIEEGDVLDFYHEEKRKREL